MQVARQLLSLSYWNLQDADAYVALMEIRRSLVLVVSATSTRNNWAGECRQLALTDRFAAPQRFCLLSEELLPRRQRCRQANS
jgi:hypothetical protein